jgi:hypothetical protein
MPMSSCLNWLLPVAPLTAYTYYLYFYFYLKKINKLKRSAGGNSSFERHSQSMEERTTLDRYHHFHGHSGMCAWLAS